MNVTEAFGKFAPGTNFYGLAIDANVLSANGVFDETRKEAVEKAAKGEADYRQEGRGDDGPRPPPRLSG